MGSDKPRKRTRSREELEQQAELTERIVEAVPGGIVHVRSNGSIALANPEALRILGLSYDELTDRYTQDFETETIFEDGSPCSNEAYPVTQALLTGEPQRNVTIGVRKPDGELSWAVFNAIPVKDQNTGEVTGAVVTFIDISARKRTEAQLIAADRLASVGTLAAGVAHEVNNPLTYLLFKLQKLRRRFAAENADPELRADADLALEGAERIRSIVEDLGSYARADNDEPGPVDVISVVELAAKMVANELRYRAKLVRDYQDVPAVLANESRLGQVFVNLLINGVQAIAEGDVAHNEIRVSTRVQPDGCVRIEVADTGHGIPAELLGRVFEPFITTKPRGKGTGLGLHICHNIVTSMHGQLSVSSEVGSGTVFSVVLPQAKGRAATVQALGSEPEIPTTERGLRILVVDDEEAIRDVFRATLPEHEIVTSASGREAIAELDGEDFDLVFCDLLMPDLTGMDVYSHLSEKRPEVARSVVFMTGGVFTEHSREFVGTVKNRVMRKPFTPDEIVSAVAKAAGQ